MSVYFPKRPHTGGQNDSRNSGMDFAGAVKKGLPLMTHKYESSSSRSEQREVSNVRVSSLASDNTARRGLEAGHTTVANFKSANVSPTIEEFRRRISRFEGLGKGIEGRNNSCYMDALLTSTFMTTDTFINLIGLSRIDSPLRSNVLVTLLNVANKIRNPPYFCSYMDVEPLRDILVHVNPKFKGQMMDVDEVIKIIFGSIFKLKPFIEYSVGTSNFLHQIILPPMPPNSRERRRDISLQSLLQQSIRYQGLIGFAQVPNPLLIAMPRSNGKLIGVEAVIPNLLLDITPLCSKECQEGPIEKVYYLHAVICLKNLHYTAFIFDKDSGLYIYYDSMSNATGQPWVRSCPGFEEFVTEALSSTKDVRFENFETQYQKVLTDCRLCIYFPKTSENGRGILKNEFHKSSENDLQDNQKNNVAGPRDSVPSIPDRSTKPERAPALPKPKTSTADSRSNEKPDIHNINKSAWEQRQMYKDRNNAVSEDSMFANR